MRIPAEVHAKNLPLHLKLILYEHGLPQKTATAPRTHKGQTRSFDCFPCSRILQTDEPTKRDLSNSLIPPTCLRR